MPRYFIEISYKGTCYSGFQVQNNANTIQAEVEKALQILSDNQIVLTGSSRTDAGVHALQNYFHFDVNENISSWRGVKDEDELVYKINAILPNDIAVHNIRLVRENAHCRFDALSRTYRYYIYRTKDPFLLETAYYYPYVLSENLLQEAASLLKDYTDFTSFSKRNTQVKTFQCALYESYWEFGEKQIVYIVKANRFLRGMVRALVATQLKVGRNKLTIEDFKQLIESAEPAKAFFSAPAKGLFLEAIEYPVL
ncbi:MAG: tRNA pseudouridine(38-40) synthase TruA [Bacteroidetes bacterium]|nr:tRNA pseudouridine(38-40) synthase TruA [Bacteroidota bacterium]